MVLAGIKLQVGLIEEGERCAGGETDYHANRRELATGELLDSPVNGEPEVVYEFLGEGLVSAVEEPGGAAQDMLHLEVVRVLLALLDEAGAGEDAAFSTGL